MHNVYYLFIKKEFINKKVKNFTHFDSLKWPLFNGLLILKDEKIKMN